MPVFTERQRMILAALRSRGGWVPGRELSELTGTSRRTLQNDIKNINLSSGNSLIRSNNRLGYCLDGAIPEIEAPRTVVPQGQYSTSKALLLVLLFEAGYLHIEELADRLFVSRSTVNAHLAQARRIVARNREARLVVSPRRGLWIEAGEETKRLLCAKLMNEDLDYGAMLRMPQMTELSQLEQKLQSFLPQILLRDGILISGQAFQDFTRFLAISITRSRLGMGMPDTGGEKCTSHFICELSREVRQRVGYSFSRPERELIRERVHELNLLVKGPVNDGKILRAISDFEREVREQSGIPLQFSADLRRNLGDHLKRMCRRILSRHNNVGQYTREVFAAYPLTVHLIKTCLEPGLGLKIPDAEMGYLAMYIGCAMEELQQKVGILMVSDANAAALYSVCRKIRNLDRETVGEIQVLPRYAYEQDPDRYLAQNRVYLTTEPALSLGTADFLSLSVFPTEAQLEQVRTAVEQRARDQRREQQEQMKKRYPCERQPGGRRFYEQVVAPRLEGGDPRMTAVTVGNSLLCVVEHEAQGLSQLQCFAVEEPVHYHGKRITALLYAAYRGDLDPLPFFAYLRAILQEKEPPKCP